MTPVRNSRFVNLLMTLLRMGLGIFFIAVGVQKIGGLGETSQFLVRSRLPISDWFAMPLACTGVAMELVVGVCILFRLQYRGAATWGVVMTSVYLLLYTQAWARGLELSCNCLGSTHEIVNYPLDTGLRLLLLGAMLLILWDSRSSSFSLGSSRRFDFSEL